VAVRLEQAQWSVLGEHDKAIRATVHRYIAKRPDVLTRHGFDDLLQEARAAACAALATYCESSEVKPEAYLFGCVRFALMRCASQAIREFATPEDVMADEELDESLPDVLRHLLRRLSKQDRNFIVMRYGLNGQKALSLQELADKMSLCRSSIHYRQQRIEKRLAELGKATSPPLAP
jgi:RNA polymerase sigma factor (sigma-70 family)